jgi:hypothetical protein
VLPQKRNISDLETSEQLHESQGKRVNFSFDAEQVAVAAERHGSEWDERVGDGEFEQQEGDVGSHMPEEHVTNQAQEEDMGEDEDEDEDDDDDDAWRQRIDLRAVECCDHGVQLTTPPFPFYQYWDSRYDTRKKRRTRRSSRVQRRASPDYTVGGCA